MCSVANNRNTDLKWLKQIVFIFLTYKSSEIGAVGTGSLSFVSIASWPQDGNFSSRHHTMFKVRRGRVHAHCTVPLSLFLFLNQETKCFPRKALPLISAHVWFRLGSLDAKMGILVKATYWGNIFNKALKGAKKADGRSQARMWV